MAGVGDKQHTRAVLFELLDEVIELLAEDALPEPSGVGLESRQQDTFSIPSGSEPFTCSGSWATVSGNGQHDQVI